MGRPVRNAGLLAVVVAIVCAACRPEPRPPHIVVVTFDTLRADHIGASAQGNSATPHVDAFAAGALVHTAAFTTMPTTAPAHASLLTGLHPCEHGVTQNGMDMSAELAATRSLPARLREAGYATGAFVTSSVFGPNLMGLAGLDRVDLPKGAVRSGEEAVDAALAWLDESRGKPVFLWVHFFEAHSPYGSTAEKLHDYPVDPATYGWVDRSRYAEPKDRTRMAEKYARGVREADAAFGRLAAGARARLDADPLIVATADHGEFLDELLDTVGFAYGHGSILDEPVLRIPLLIAGPGVAPGRTTGAVSIRDVYTTVLEAAGLGDPTAAAEDRRDLRVGSSKERTVSAERRSFGRADQQRMGIGSAELQQIRRNAVAVTDGTELLVLGEDGTVRLPRSSPSGELEAAAQRRLAARRAPAGAPDSPTIDAETRRALESLGYAH